MALRYQRYPIPWSIVQGLTSQGRYLSIQIHVLHNTFQMLLAVAGHAITLQMHYSTLLPYLALGEVFLSISSHHTHHRYPTGQPHHRSPRPLRSRHFNYFLSFLIAAS